ncbi:MAG: membrane protein insertase YidC [Planctomycetes bacterium]|nr:membrane protein insertase YidC [Planctomycetota bacterium]
MEKRLPLFLFLALLFYFGWIVLFPPPHSAPPPPSPADVLEQGATPTPEQGALAAAAMPALAESQERELALDVGGAAQSGAPGRRGAYHARFSNRGARLLSLDLADYVRAVGLDETQRRDPANWLPLVESVETASGRTGSLLWDTRQSSQSLAPGGLAQALWQMEALAAPEVGVRFRYSPPEGRVVFEKKIAFEPDTWHLRLTLSIHNVSAGAAKKLGFALVPAAIVPAELGDRFYAEPSAVAIWRAGDKETYQGVHKSAPGLKVGDAFDAPKALTAFGLYNKYFAFLVREATEGAGSLSGARYEPLHEVRPLPRPLMSVEASVSLDLPPEGETRSWEYVVYAGPKDPQTFSADCAAHQVVLDEDLGWTRSIAKALLYVLSLFEGLLGNWGLAIILLTLCVRGMLFPLNRRSQTSMARYQKKMKRVQPRLEEAKKKFAGDATKLREAQARIMQEEGAFPPLGGCLPVFLQMPIFFGLFSALRVSSDLRQAPFYGWIHDLSRPDHLLYLGLEIPILPSLEYLNVLPLLMVVLWILQQMGMPLPADEQAARMQKMMRFMPAVFGLMLYNYAAGLSLYMITTSGCSIIEQKVIKKLWPIDDTEQEKSTKKGCGPFSGILQNLAEKQKEQMKRVQAAQAEQRRRDGKKRK